MTPVSHGSHKRLFAAIAAAVGLASGAFAATIDLSTVTADMTLNDKDVITGTLGAKVKLSIADNALVTLRNATIDGSNNALYPWAGLTCLGNAEIRIDGINYVRGFYQQHPGIYVPAGKTLTIRQAVNNPIYQNALGGGTLEARDNGMAAGIGAGANSACGNIVIESGIITAQGHNAAGIGGGGDAACGDITIKGGVVCATGGFDGAGIGGCGSSGCGAITIGEGVTRVVAQAGSKCENPIGAGAGGTCGAVTVNLAEGATDTTDATGWYPTRTIEGRVGAEQYANGVAWKFRLVDGGAEICDEYHVSSGEAHYRPAISSDTAGALVVPDTLGGCPVTRIGNSACGSCKKIDSVTIPASVTSIGERAFQYCEALADVAMAPSGVTDIGERAFEHCTSLTGMAIPATVTDIGVRAFAGCDGLTSVTIPGGVKRIGDSAFEGCGDLASVTIEDGVETIGEGAFGYCGSLTDVTIPASVKRIEDRAFQNCTSLATANIPQDATVAEGAFLNCIALADANGFIIIHNVLHQYVGGEADVTVPAGVTRLGGLSFAGHTSNPAFGTFPPLVSVTLPDSVTSIGGAFAFCMDLESIRFPAKMPSVEDGAFYLCVKLADADGFVVIGGVLHMYMGTASAVTIPDGVTSIGPESSFLTYTGVPPHYFWTSPIQSLTIPSGATKIGPRAFSGCPDLTTVSIPATVTDIGEAAFLMGSTLPLQTVHVEVEDTERVKELLLASGHPVDTITFVEDYLLPRTVTFDANGGEASETERIVTDGAALGALPTATRSGYTFNGWFTKATGGTKVSAATKVTADATYRAQWTKSGGGTTPTPSPPPTPEPPLEPGVDPPSEPEVDPPLEPEVVPYLYETVAGTAPAAASVYDGCLTDAKGAVAGSIQIKVGRPNARTGLASVKATVLIPGEPKKNLKAEGGGKAAIASAGPTTIALAGGDPCKVVLGLDGLAGTYGTYLIDGARNFFTSRDKTEQGAAEALLAKVPGAVNLIWSGGTASVTIARKGKAKATLVLSSGAKATAATQLLVGDAWLCVPVVEPKKTKVAFAVWIPRNGGTVLARGLGDGAVAGRAGALGANARFRVDTTAALWSQIAGKALTAYLPDGLSVESGARWTVAGGARPGKVVYQRGTANVDAAKLGANPSALKLTYKAKDGSFKGTFKVYADNGGRLKATTVNVTGVVLDGVGYGTATIRKPAGSIPVTIE